MIGDTMNKTKIVATIGPASQDKEILKQMILAGLDVIRINMSHADYKFCDDVISKLKELNQELNTNVALMMDLNGPTVVVNRLKGKQLTLKTGDTIEIYGDREVDGKHAFSVSYDGLGKDLKYNSHLVLDDHEIILKVIDKSDDIVTCLVEKGGNLKLGMKVISPDCKLRFPFLTEKDKKDILYAHEHDVDFLALSFVMNSENVLEVNDLLIQMNDNRMSILTKIETEEAVDEIDEIIRVSDGIIIARGDLGISLPVERIPGIQKMIIHKCHNEGKVSLVATEFLASMESSSHPTRAEVSDIANAVLDGVDSVILCGETTIGKYPIEALTMMEKIIETSEEDVPYFELLDIAMRTEEDGITGTLAYSVVTCANRLRCVAIVTPTVTGYTARRISRFRPICPIVALCEDESVIKQLSLYFGVYGVKISEFTSFDKMMKEAMKELKQFMDTKEHDKVIITGGYPFRKVKHTNFMRIEEL